MIAQLASPSPEDLRFTALAAFLRLMVAQKLGTLTADDERLEAYDRLIDELAAAGRCRGSAATNRVYFAVQVRRHDVFELLRTTAARATRLGLTYDRSYLGRELARAEIDHGHLGTGIARLGAILEGGEIFFGAERVETRLELAAAQIEACDLRGAAASLAETAPWVDTSSFVAAYHAALSRLRGWLLLATERRLRGLVGVCIPRARSPLSYGRGGRADHARVRQPCASA